MSQKLVVACGYSKAFAFCSFPPRYPGWVKYSDGTVKQIIAFEDYFERLFSIVTSGRVMNNCLRVIKEVWGLDTDCGPGSKMYEYLYEQHRPPSESRSEIRRWFFNGPIFYPSFYNYPINQWVDPNEPYVLTQYRHGFVMSNDPTGVTLYDSDYFTRRERFIHLITDDSRVRLPYDTLCRVYDQLVKLNSEPSPKEQMVSVTD